MTPALDAVIDQLRNLPGLGRRSAERIALHLLVEQRTKLLGLQNSLETAAKALNACPICGNLAENGDLCPVCQDATRDAARICVVEQISDLIAIERSSAWRGRYHVLNGKLSPMKDIGPADLNLTSLSQRLQEGIINEIVLALPNDIEGQATCHYIQDEIVGDKPIALSRIGFGLPSGSGVTYADAITLRSAIESRRYFTTPNQEME
jgi:recombination protein RecR